MNNSKNTKHYYINSQQSVGSEPLRLVSQGSDKKIYDFKKDVFKNIVKYSGNNDNNYNNPFKNKVIKAKKLNSSQTATVQNYSSPNVDKSNKHVQKQFSNKSSAISGYESTNSENSIQKHDKDTDDCFSPNTAYQNQSDNSIASRYNFNNKKIDIKEKEIQIKSSILTQNNCNNNQILNSLSKGSNIKHSEYQIFPQKGDKRTYSQGIRIIPQNIQNQIRTNLNLKNSSEIIKKKVSVINEETLSKYPVVVLNTEFNSRTKLTNERGSNKIYDIMNKKNTSHNRNYSADLTKVNVKHSL